MFLSYVMIVLSSFFFFKVYLALKADGIGGKKIIFSKLSQLL